MGVSRPGMHLLPWLSCRYICRCRTARGRGHVKVHVNAPVQQQVHVVQLKMQKQVQLLFYAQHLPECVIT